MDNLCDIACTSASMELKNPPSYADLGHLGAMEVAIIRATLRNHMTISDDSFSWAKMWMEIPFPTDSKGSWKADFPCAAFKLFGDDIVLSCIRIHCG